MANEIVMWTVLPTGVEPANLETGTGRALKFSLFLTPKLTASGELGDGQFPAFEQWTSLVRELSVDIDFEGATFPPGSYPPGPTYPPGPSRARAVLDLDVLQPEYWSRVFPRSTAVTAWTSRDLEDRTVRSYSVTELRNKVLDLYKQVATNSKLATLHPTLKQPSAVKDFIEDLKPIHDVLSNYRERRKGTKDPNNEVLDNGADVLTGKPAQFFKALRFYMRPEGTLSEDVVPPAPELPEYDFHQALALLSDHGPLLRLLGIVIDGRLLLPQGARIPTESRLRVTSIALGSKAQTLTAECPWTRYTFANKQFLPLPKPGSEIRQGLLRLANQEMFDVFELDADGAVLKTADFAINMARLTEQTKGQKARKPDSAALPALRSAGFTFVRRERKKAVEDQAAMLPGANAQPNSATLFADDVTRGYRLDVNFRGAWYSVCQRAGTLHVGTGESSVDLDVEDEGYVKAVSATSSRTPGVTVNELYLHEAFATWKGWSLVARRPGRVIPPLPGKEPVPPNREVLTDFGVSSDYRAMPGSLPRLRFGEIYRFRVRTVDLAGNSLPPDVVPEGTFWQSKPLPYLRYEPVSSPALLPQAPLRRGETIETLAIRTQVFMEGHPVLPPGLFNAETARHVVPPKTSQLMAEQHGMLDPYLPSDPGLAFRISVKEQGTLMDRQLVNPYETAFDAAVFPAKLEPANGVALAQGDEEIPWPVYENPGDAPAPGDPLPRGQYVINKENQIGLPYLPDPATRGLALRDADDNVAVHEFAGSWPDLRPFRLIVRSGAFAFNPLSDGDFELTLPPGTMTRFRYSSLPRQPELSTLAFAQNLGAKLLSAAQLGQHWMLTPYRELLVVHAVQKPVRDPVLDIRAERDAGTTYASLRGSVSSHSQSTAEVDIKGQWIDPVDTGPDGPSEEHHHGFAFKRSIGYEESYALFAKDPPPRHEFGDTKHRLVEYRAVGKTRYADYFPVSVTQDVGNITRSSAPVGPVNILSSARPDAPRVLYVVPTFRWIQSADGLSSQRIGRGLRVYLDRPWFSSGRGELLAAVLPVTPIAPQTMQDIRAYVSEWGADPIWNNAPPEVELTPQRFSNRALTLGKVQLAELDGVQVRAVGFPVEYDPERKLWRCDIEMDVDNLYFPFVRLALARLQPNSVTDLRLSRVVKTEFAQLAPDRKLTLQKQANLVRVTLLGPEALNSLGEVRQLPTNPTAGQRAGAGHVVVARIERRRPNEGPGESALDWRPLSDEIQLVSFLADPSSQLLSWRGNVPWTDRDPTYQYRLVVREYEMFQSDEGTADATIPIWQIPPHIEVPVASRLVHLDILALTP